MILLFLSQIHKIRMYTLSRKISNKKNGIMEEKYFVEPWWGWGGVLGWVKNGHVQIPLFPPKISIFVKQLLFINQDFVTSSVPPP